MRLRIMKCYKTPYFEVSFLPPYRNRSSMTTTSRTPAARSGKQGEECCMCGDHGVSSELFHCKLCLFRSQHRYCSNVYPKAETYTVCNWCLHKDSPPPAGKNTSCIDDSKKKKKRAHLRLVSAGGDPGKRLSVSSPEGSPSPSGRKRIISKGRLEEIILIRRTKSEGILPAQTNDNNIATQQNRIRKQPVFRNKVRRYKLLDEVST